MASPIKPGDFSYSLKPKKEVNRPLHKITGTGLGPIEAANQRARLLKGAINYAPYQNPSKNFADLFESLTYRTTTEILNKFKDGDFCEVSNRFSPNDIGTRCVRSTHIGESEEVPNRVHANYVKLIDECPSLICSQAPTHEMEESFWLQIVQHSSLVVDLTNENDKNINEVHEYFPDELMGLLLGSVSVDVVSTDPELGEAKYQVFLQGRPAKEVERLHFADWPEKGVITLDQLDKLLDRIEKKQAQSPKERLWIHCCAGVGRTGTIAVALALRYLHRQGDLNSENYQHQIDELVLKGRAQRDVFFVQSKEQYQLLIQYAEKLLGIAR